MAHNINNVRYVHMPNAGNQQAPLGLTYQIPPNYLAVVTARLPDRRKIAQYKLSIGIPASTAGEDLYGRWRDIVKDQMVARNFADLHAFPDAEFQQIVQGMRRLRPACDTLATTSAANNIHRLQQADDAVVQLVKDCERKLITTLGNRLAAAAWGAKLGPLGQPGVQPAQVIVLNTLLPMNALME